MNVFDKLSAGWRIAMSSFKVLNAKKDLLIFPILSGISIILVVASFFFGFVSIKGWDFLESADEINTPAHYLVYFVFYVVNYFIVVFFNMALVHCSRLYFRGEEVTVAAGLRFSMSKIGVILSWSVFAATIGLLLRVLQENLGIIGKFVTGLIGIVWSVATFFVVPIIAYEDAGPIDAVKRSTQLMKEKWGESLGGNFSFGLIQFLGIVVVGLPLYLLGAMIHPLAGIAAAVIGVFIVISIISAAQVIFVSAVYHDITGDVTEHFDRHLVDDLFEQKKRW